MPPSSRKKSTKLINWFLPSSEIREEAVGLLLEKLFGPEATYADDVRDNKVGWVIENSTKPSNVDIEELKETSKKIEEIKRRTEARAFGDIPKRRDSLLYDNSKATATSPGQSRHRPQATAAGPQNDSKPFAIPIRNQQDTLRRSLTEPTATVSRSSVQYEISPRNGLPPRVDSLRRGSEDVLATTNRHKVGQEVVPSESYEDSEELFESTPRALTRRHGETMQKPIAQSVAAKPLAYPSRTRHEVNDPKFSYVTDGLQNGPQGFRNPSRRHNGHDTLSGKDSARRLPGENDDEIPEVQQGSWEDRSRYSRNVLKPKNEDDDETIGQQRGLASKSQGGPNPGETKHDSGNPRPRHEDEPYDYETVNRKGASMTQSQGRHGQDPRRPNPMYEDEPSGDDETIGQYRPNKDSARTHQRHDGQSYDRQRADRLPSLDHHRSLNSRPSQTVRSKSYVLESRPKRGDETYDGDRRRSSKDQRNSIVQSKSYEGSRGRRHEDDYDTVIIASSGRRDRDSRYREGLVR